MKKVFKIVVVLITILCYNSTVFEWDENEFEKNYQTEGHLYVAEKQINIDHSVQLSIPPKITTAFLETRYNYVFYPRIKSFFSVKYFLKKTDRIYLLHQNLLI